MNNLYLLIPLMLGTVGILQGGFNRNISNDIGVAQAVFFGCIVTLVIASGFYFVVRLYPQYFPAFFQAKASIGTFKLWYIIPGIFGFFILTGFPMAISKLGAVKLLVGLVAAQMIASVLWDIFVEKIPMNTLKVAGMFFAAISVACISLSK